MESMRRAFARMESTDRTWSLSKAHRASTFYLSLQAAIQRGSAFPPENFPRL